MPTSSNHDQQAPERRVNATAALAAIEERLTAGTRRMDALEEAMRRNTELTQEVLEIMSTAKAGFRALGWLGAGVRWIGGIAAACAAAWAFWQSIRHGGGGI